MAQRNLKIVRLIEPEMCMECRFCTIANVETDRGATQRMIHCRRLDCDNWDTATAEPARPMNIDDVEDAA